MANNIRKIVSQEHETVILTGKGFGGCTLTFFGYTVNGYSNCVASILPTTFSIPKNSCIQARVDNYYRSVSISGGTYLASNSDRAGNWTYTISCATSPLTIDIYSSRDY